MMTLDQLCKRRKIGRLARSIKRVEYVLLGGYRKGINDTMRHFINHLIYKDVVLPDDGTDTILVNEGKKLSAGIEDSRKTVPAPEHTMGFKAL